MDAPQRFQYPHAGARIERAGGFVAQQHGRALGNGARDRHPLLLAARELGRKMVLALTQPDPLQRLRGRHRVGGDVGHQLHVFQRRQAGDEVIELEHETDRGASEARQLGFLGRAQVVALTLHLTAAGSVQPAQDVEQGRFAAARGPQQHHELARVQVEVDAAQRLHLHLAHGVVFAQGARTKYRFGCCSHGRHDKVRPVIFRWSLCA